MLEELVTSPSVQRISSGNVATHIRARPREGICHIGKGKKGDAAEDYTLRRPGIRYHSTGAAQLTATYDRTLDAMGLGSTLKHMRHRRYPLTCVTAG